MKLRQAIGIIMGANVGTTITSWILSLSGIEGDSLVMQLLKPSSFSAVFAFVGIILLMFCNSEKKKHLGTFASAFWDSYMVVEYSIKSSQIRFPV